MPAQAADARLAAERAASYFADELGVAGAYAWAYRPDMSVRRGKGGPIGETEGLVQPPGTPAVGAAFLALYEATDSLVWLVAAQEAARALVDAQLHSGGWQLMFDVAPEEDRTRCYRTEMSLPECKAIDGHKYKNISNLDDNITQGALSFLIWYDKILDGREEAVRETIDLGLQSVLDNIYSSGACPLRMPVASRHRDDETIASASIEEDWPREWEPPRERPPYYIFGDDLQRDCIRLLLRAERRFGTGVFLLTAGRVADFILRAQLPAPQAGWAQIYDGRLTPVWGRRFEPPAVASSETRGAIQALSEMYVATGDDRYLEGAERAASWLRSVQLEDGQWARFYELGTDRPLYVDEDNRLTSSREKKREGYSFVGTFGIPETLGQLEAISADGASSPADPWWPNVAHAMSDEVLLEEAARLIATQDEAGRWIRDGWISSEDFVDGIFVLSRAIERGLEPATGD